LLDEDSLVEIYTYMYMLYVSSFSNKNIEINITIDLIDIYNSEIKRISYNRVLRDMKVQEHVLFLELDGIKKRYEIGQLGDFNQLTQEFSNVVINVEINFENEQSNILTLNETINMFDLYYTFQINIYQYYFGVTKDLTYLNGEVIFTGRYIPYTHGSIMVVNNKGLPNEDGVRENLYIVFELDMKQNTITNSDKDAVKKIFSSCV
jgi:hypothetical protein